MANIGLSDATSLLYRAIANDPFLCTLSISEITEVMAHLTRTFILDETEKGFTCGDDLRSLCSGIINRP